jgi:hypothetical protein
MIHPQNLNVQEALEFPSLSAEVIEEEKPTYSGVELQIPCSVSQKRNASESR